MDSNPSPGKEFRSWMIDKEINLSTSHTNHSRSRVGLNSTDNQKDYDCVNHGQQISD